jgi:hypothetical protein
MYRYLDQWREMAQEQQTTWSFLVIQIHEHASLETCT